jgi:hypothetical protein
MMGREFGAEIARSQLEKVLGPSDGSCAHRYHCSQIRSTQDASPAQHDAFPEEWKFTN